MRQQTAEPRACTRGRRFTAGSRLGFTARFDVAPLAERRVVEKLGAALPRATVRFFPGVGHMGPISHASLINEAIAAHLQD
ncbi:MAG: hypothetical protein AABO58_07535 [Acidobacteriota bacterium]